MNTFYKVAAQGEVTTDIIDCIPQEATLKKVEPINGRIILSHSERGHDHYIPSGDVDVLERTDNVPSGMKIFYSIVKNPTALIQDAPVPHNRIDLEPRIYRHRIAREYNPFLEEARQVQD